MKKQSYRNPPLPDCFYNIKAGHCRWCGLGIFNENGELILRRRWHKECYHEFMIVSRPNYAKRQVKKRDKGICCSCGKFCRYRNEWDIDHIIALKDIPSIDIKYWKLENLCTRCIDCHKAKSKEENKIRRVNKLRQLD